MEVFLAQFINQLPQQLVNGLTLGGIYALIALGYSMVYGVLRLLNFAHGDVYMLGAFAGFFVLEGLLPADFAVSSSILVIAAMMIVAMLFCGIVGVAIERFAYRPLRHAPRIAPLISALGVSFFLQNSVLLLLGGNFHRYKTNAVIPISAAIEMGSVRLAVVRAFVIIMAVVLMIILWFLVHRTRLGTAMRAVATDSEAAAMLGVDVDRIIVVTFFIGSALAGAAGVLNGLVFFRVWHYMGFTAGLKGFVAAVLGGIGSIPGAMLGGFLLGLIEAFATGFISSTFDDAIVFLVLILVLLIRPSGLLGARRLQKV